MGMLGEIGTLQPGTLADLAILELSTGSFTFTDSKKQTRQGEQKLDPISTIRAGRLYDPSAFDYQ
jgi:predicted amidohydrolase